MTKELTPEILPQIDVRLGDLVDAPRNPNRMPDHKREALRKIIRRNGLAQELVVWKPNPEGDEYEIVDGHHRKDVLLELWSLDEKVPCRDASGLDPVDRKELSLSLNNNRGELDLTLVSTEVDELIAEGRTIEDLEVTGFTIEELEALTGATIETTEEQLLEDASALERTREEEKPERVFEIVIPVKSANERRKLLQTLRKAGGRGNKDLRVGLLALAGWDKSQ